MVSTKDNIIDKAISLFNERGFSNVSMKDIADAAEISPGNLTYHFKRKEDLLLAIHKQMNKEQDALATSINELPGFENIHALMVPLMDLNLKYRFFFADMLHIVRTFPSIDKLNKEHIKRQIFTIKAVIDFSVQTGNMKPEQREGQYADLAHTCWMLFYFWLQQQLITGDKGSYHNQARFAIWNLGLPLFTAKGLRNFQNVAAEQENYINSIQ